VPVHITGREFGILELLSVHKGTTVTKDTILTYLYAGMVEPDQKIIDVFVCTLRRKLSEPGLARR
jgi:two-component system cell cycle response regulator CtrA